MKKLLISSLLILFCTQALSATQLKKTICPSGCDYTSLEACMNANEQNLVTADKYFDVEISGTWSSADTTAVTIHNYTTDSTRYINIYTTGDARHNGIVGGNESAYVLQLSSNSNNISISGDNIYLTIDGLTFKAVAASYSYQNAIILSSSVPKWTIKNNIFWGSGTATFYHMGGIQYGGATTGGEAYIYNNIFYNLNDNRPDSFVGFGIKCRQAFGTSYVYSNTFYGNYMGLHAANSSNVIGKNNLSYNNDLDYDGNAFSASSANNISLDTTSPNEDYREKAITFADVGEKDFRLASTDTDAIDKGADLGSDYNVDIIGTSRPQGAGWDIGAFEAVTKRRLLMGVGI